MNVDNPGQTALHVSDAPNGELRRLRFLVGGLFLLALFSAIYFARALLLPMALAILLTLTLRPVMRALSRVGLPKGLSAAVLTLGASAVLALIIYSLSGPLATMTERAPYVGFEIREKLRPIITQLSEVQAATEQIEDVARGEEGAGGDTQSVVVERRGLLGASLANLASAGTSLVVALVLTLFLLGSGDFYIDRVSEMGKRGGRRAKVLSLVQDVEREVSRYLMAITLINAGLGLAIGVSLWLLGVPYAHLWGLGAFILNFLPYLGAIVGATALAAVSILTFDSVAYAMVAPAVYLILTSIEGQMLTPMILGRSLSLNTVAVLVSVMLWVWLWGVAGAFLAVPILVLVKVFSCHLEGMREFGRFLSSGPRES